MIKTNKKREKKLFTNELEKEKTVTTLRKDKL